MVSSSELFDGKSKTEGKQPTMTELIMQIENLCVQAGMSYDRTPPVSVSPGIWMFSAVPMHDKCKRHGFCRQMQFFAADIGGKLKLT